VGTELSSNGTGQLANISIQTLQKNHRPIQWAGNLKRIKFGLLSLGRLAHSKGRSLHWRPLYRSPTRGSRNSNRPLCEGPYHTLRFGRRGCCFMRVRVPNLTDTATIPHHGLVELELPHSSDREISYYSLSIWYCCLPFTNGNLKHSDLAHLQLTSNQREKTPNPTTLLSVPPLTTSTLMPTPDYDRLILTDSERTRTKHIRKGHQRHGHPQLAHISQRDHKPTTHK